MIYESHLILNYVCLFLFAYPVQLFKLQTKLINFQKK